MAQIKENYKGIFLCFLIAIPSWFLGNLFNIVGGPVFAILLGMFVTLFLKDRTNFQKGIQFTSKKILQLAVILLGFGMNLRTIFKVGVTSLPIIISTILTSLIISYIIFRLLKVPPRISILVGVGSSICGGSAIAATAPVIGADDGEIAQSISVIFLFNLIAALLFPALGMLLGLSNEGFGIFAGTAINDTSSVTAAASSWDDLHSSSTLELATIVKLTRTLAIIPITLCLAFYQTRKKSRTSESSVSLRKIFPFFIIYFLLASVLTTLFPFDFFSNIKSVSKFFIIMAMGAIGLNTNVIKLFKSGLKPIFMGLCCWIGIAGVSLVMQYLIGYL